MEIIFVVAILIFSIVIHEVAHGSMANSLGDPTAKYAGRLTLNPLKHLDFIGSLVVPFLLVVMRSPFVFGWAKPVPVNPYNFNDQKYGQLKVSLAGPASNIIIALFFGIASRFIPLEANVREMVSNTFPAFTGEVIALGFWGQIFYLFLFIVFVNTLLAIFNLIPIPPLDGSHVLFFFFPGLERKIGELHSRMGFLGFTIFLFLMVFFLFPFILQFISMLFRFIIGT